MGLVHFQDYNSNNTNFMALPVANLGYMPNMNAPSGGGTRTVGPNAWEQLAMQVAAGMLTKGVDNAMSKDYTKQAQQEGLAVDPKAEQASFLKKILQGPTTDQKQLGQLRGEKSAADAVKTREAGDDRRSSAAISAADKRSASEMEARKLLTEMGINSDQFLAKLGHQGKENQGNLDRAAQLNALEYTQAQQNTRNDADNAGGLARANVMAGSAVNQAKVLEAVQKLLQQGQTSNMLNPNNPNATTGGVDPAVLDAIQKLLTSQQTAP